MYELEKIVKEKYEAHGYKVLHKGAPDFLCYQLDEDNEMENIVFVEVKQNYKPLTKEQRIWKEALKTIFDYTVVTPDGVRDKDIKSSIRCKCEAMTPKGVVYHPSLVSVYKRVGAKGKLTKTGYQCPKCNQFYDLSGVKK